MKKKNLIITCIALLIAGFILIWHMSGGILGEIFFNRPNKPIIEHEKFPFEITYEYNNKQFAIKDTIVCDYEGISFSIDGGNKRQWNCYITNNDNYGRYYLDKEKYPTLYIQIPLEAEYYMGASDFDKEFAIPYIHFIDDRTGTTYYEQDLTNVVNAKIISCKLSEPLRDNFK